jgi:hypothetical protein
MAILCRGSRWPNRHAHFTYDVSPVPTVDGGVVDTGAEIHGVVDFGYKSAKYQVNGSWQIEFVKEDNRSLDRIAPSLKRRRSQLHYQFKSWETTRVVKCHRASMTGLIQWFRQVCCPTHAIRCLVLRVAGQNGAEAKLAGWVVLSLHERGCLFWQPMSFPNRIKS